MRVARHLEVTADVRLSRGFPAHIPMSSMSVEKAHFKAVRVCQCVVWYCITPWAKERLNKHRRGGTYPSLREPPKVQKPLHITCNT